MKTEQTIKRLANEEGFDVIKSLGPWNGLDIYGVDTSDASDIGLPQYIIVSGDEVRWATVSETKELMSAFI